MAWNTDKPSGAALVRWRENGKKRSKQFPTRAEAEAFVASSAASSIVISRSPRGQSDLAPMAGEIG